MARVETIVVGGGINPGVPFAAQGIAFVQQVSPPLIATSPDFFHVVGPPEAFVFTSTAADPAAGASVILRTRGGIANYEGGTNNRSYGDGHTIDTTPSGFFIAGRLNTILSTAGGNSILVGTALSHGSAQGIMFGNNNTTGSGYNVSPMINIGESNTIGNGGGGVSGDITLIGGGVTISGGTNFDSVAICSNVAIGAGLGRSVLIGNSDGAGSVGASTDSNVIIGYRFTLSASKSNSVSLGAFNTIAHNSCIALGGSVTTTADNQCWIGGALFSGFINTVIIGSGDTNGTQHNVTIRLTNGSGTDNAGNSLTIQAGLSTGAGASPALNLNVSVTAASSATLNASRTGVRVSHTSTATETYLMIYDVDNATLERVTVGAADSGGAGFKLLRIPN